MDTGGETKLVARLPNGPAAIEQSRLAVIRFLEPFGIFGRTINRVEVVLEELVGNLVRYGKSVNQVTVAAGYRGGVIDLVIDDRADIQGRLMPGTERAIHPLTSVDANGPPMLCLLGVGAENEFKVRARLSAHLGQQPLYISLFPPRDTLATIARASKQISRP